MVMMPAPAVNPEVEQAELVARVVQEAQELPVEVQAVAQVAGTMEKQAVDPETLAMVMMMTIRRKTRISSRTSQCLGQHHRHRILLLPGGFGRWWSVS